MLYLQKKNLKKLSKNISHTKVEYHCHYTGKYRDVGHSTCNLKFNTPNKIPIVFYKGSNYDYYFIINVLTISYKIFFFDSGRFMASPLSNLVDNLAEGIHKIKFKDCDCFPEYERVKDNMIKYKCFSCSKIIQTNLMKN